jgi:hypothetical protein
MGKSLRLASPIRPSASLAEISSNATPFFPITARLARKMCALCRARQFVRDVADRSASRPHSSTGAKVT